jgi:hypothetical protein
MVIEIKIRVDGKDVKDYFKRDRTNLIENALAIRRIEEIKRLLLDIEYKSDFEIKEDYGE